MKTIQRLVLICILFTCQQYITAQNYNLGKQKQSFAYKTLYASHVQVSQVIINNNQPVNAQKTSTDENAEDVIKRHRQIVQLINNLAGQSAFRSIVMDVYIKIYQSKSQENMINLKKIQSVVISYLNSKGSAYPTLDTELKNAASMEEEIAVFLSYSQEQ